MPDSELLNLAAQIVSMLSDQPKADAEAVLEIVETLIDRWEA